MAKSKFYELTIGHRCDRCFTRFLKEEGIIENKIPYPQYDLMRKLYYDGYMSGLMQKKR